jgi:hypothetical protein
MRRWVSAAVPFVAVLVCIAGCEFLRGRRGPPTAPPPGPPVEAGGLSVSALPVYRLIANPMLIDAPSRLLVLHVRFSTNLDRAMSFTPEDTALALVGGERARVFDRGRAMELVRRTTLANADLGYVQNRHSYQPGGLDPSTLSALNELIMTNLLAEGAFTSGPEVQGYVVIDTGTPVVSLEGATLDLWAFRLSDSQPAHGRYQFPGIAAASPVAEAAQPVVALADPTPTPLAEATQPVVAVADPTATPLAEGATTDGTAAVVSPVIDVVTPTAQPAAPPADTATPAGDATVPVAATNTPILVETPRYDRPTPNLGHR